MNSARDFTARLTDLLRREHAALADFLVQLAEFDRRRLWLELGHSSLFYYLHRELGLSKGAAHYRKVAAELVQKFPEMIEPLRQGKLCITSVVELSKVITPDNAGEVLPRFFHCSKQEAKALSAELSPAEAAPRREVVTVPRLDPGPAPRELPLPPQDAGPLVHPDEPLDEEQVARPEKPAPAAPLVPARTPAPCSVEPLNGDLRRLHLTVSRRFLEKLEAARAALSHAHPGATADEILEAGLDLILAERDKRKGVVAKPRKEPPPARPEHLPAHVKRAVWSRDGGRCQWRLASGGICGSTWRVEFDHIVPRARGGPSIVDNVRLACAVHNQLAARRAFGDEWMDRFARKKDEGERLAAGP